MFFSEYYKIKKNPKDDWFDPIMNFDTRLFIDPFAIFKTEHPIFLFSHQKVINFFNGAYLILAKSNGNSSSTYYKKTLSLMHFPEAQEICLGYTNSGIMGLGSSKGFAKDITDAMSISISAGIKHFEHFEEVSIFREGIGPDRISDMIANLLKPELVKYTQDICLQYKIPTKKVALRHGSFDFKSMSWNQEIVNLPINPTTKKCILLLPIEFLRMLPSINPESFWEYVSNYESEILKHKFNFEIQGKVDKKQIVELAQKAPELVERYIKRTEKLNPDPYNLRNDPKYLYNWYNDAKTYASQNPIRLKLPKNEEDFIETINSLTKEFKIFVELRQGYKLLWYANTPRDEASVQRLFLGIAWSHCKANNICVAKEEDLGSGPVDFQFSNGFSHRMLLEVKLAKNSKFWNGLEKQLIRYLETEQIKNGHFMIILLRDDDKKRIDFIDQKISELAIQTNTNLTYSVIDAMQNKKSASKL